jgi:hypothetical protein
MAESGPGPGDCVRLLSSEGEVFQVPVRVAKVSRTLATMLAGNQLVGVGGDVLVMSLLRLDLGHQSEDLIPLPNVTSSILRKVRYGSPAGRPQPSLRSSQNLGTVSTLNEAPDT